MHLLVRGIDGFERDLGLGVVLVLELAEGAPVGTVPGRIVGELGIAPARVDAARPQRAQHGQADAEDAEVGLGGGPEIGPGHGAREVLEIQLREGNDADDGDDAHPVRVR